MFRQNIYFTQQEIEVAKAYRFDGKNDSIIVRLFLNRLWERILPCIPSCISPNILTLCGFALIAASFLYTTLNSKYFQYRINYWVRIINGVCLLFYHGLINLSRLHGIRTNSETPMAHFLRHAGSSFISIAEMMIFAASVDAYEDNFMFYLVFLLSVNFFLISWYEYATRHSYLPLINGQSEGVFCLSLIYIFLGLFPRYTAFFIRPKVERCILITFGLNSIVIIVSVIYKCVKNHNFIRNSILTTLPLIFSLALICLNFYTISPNSICFILITGLLLTFQAQQLVIGHIAGRSPAQISDYSLNIIWPLQLVPLVLEENNQLFYKILLGLLVGAMVIFDIRVVVGFIQGLNVRFADNSRLSNDVAVDVMKFNDETPADEPQI